jgi:hypothetical protein
MIYKHLINVNAMSLFLESNLMGIKLLSWGFTRLKLLYTQECANIKAFHNSKTRLNWNYINNREMDENDLTHDLENSKNKSVWKEANMETAIQWLN